MGSWWFASGAGIDGRNVAMWKRKKTDPLDNIARPWAASKSVSAGSPGDLGPAVLARLRSELQMDDEWCQLEGRELRWTGGAAPIVFSVSDPFEMNGDVTVKVTARTTLVSNVDASPDLVLELVNAANMQTSVGSLVWLADEREVVGFVTQYAHEGNDSVTALFSPFSLLAYTEALTWFSDEMATALEGDASAARDDEDDLLNVSEQVVIPAGLQPQRWDGEELVSMSEQWGSAGLMANGDETSLTVEFPYSSSMSAIVLASIGLGGMPGRVTPASTSFYYQYLDTHPRYGNGLWALLRMPDFFDEEDGLEQANELNVAELLETTGFPSWGSWCCTPEGSLGHLAFFPNLIARPGLLTTVNFYALSRSQWAQEKLLPLDLVREVRAGDR